MDWNHAAKQEILCAFHRDPSADALWKTLELLQDETFYTAKGLPFTYAIRGGELFVSRREKSITRATVELAFQKALDLGPEATGPKKLGCFGASYLYPLFLRMGILAVPAEDDPCFL